jgi:hypothetical protein
MLKIFILFFTVLNLGFADEVDPPPTPIILPDSNISTEAPSADIEEDENITLPIAPVIPELNVSSEYNDTNITLPIAPATPELNISSEYNDTNITLPIAPETPDVNITDGNDSIEPAPDTPDINLTDDNNSIESAPNPPDINLTDDNNSIESAPQTPDIPTVEYKYIYGTINLPNNIQAKIMLVDIAKNPIYGMIDNEEWDIKFPVDFNSSKRYYLKIDTTDNNGILNENITKSGECSCCTKETFYSYRASSLWVLMEI